MSAEWTAGFAVALAEVHRLSLGGNNSSGVCEVARNAGITIAAARAAGVDEYDLKELIKAGVEWGVAGGASPPLTCETCGGEGVVQVYPPGERDCKDCEGERCPQHMPTAKKCTPCRGTGKRDTGTPTPLTCICPFPRTRCPHCTWPCEACRAEERKGINDRDTGTPPGAAKRWPPQEGDEWRDVSGKPWVFSGKSAFTEWWSSHEGKGFEWRTWRESDVTNGTISFVRRGTPGAGGA